MGRPTLGEVRSYIIVFLAFATFATLLYAATIALIAVTKAYRHYSQRLRLYLAGAGLLHAIAIGLEVIPIDLDNPNNSTVTLRDNWYGVCVAIGFAAQYLTIYQTLVIVWISAYTFALVVFHRQLNKRKHEATFLLLCIFGSFLLSWEPFLFNSYGQSGGSCWISDGVASNSSLGSVFKITINIVPILIMSFGGLLMLLIAASILLRRGAISSDFLGEQYRKALKEVLPLMVYPTVYFVIIFVRIIVVFAYKFNDPLVNDVVFVSLLQMCSVALLVSIFLHGGFRRGVCTSLTELLLHLMMSEGPVDLKSVGNTTSGYKQYQEPDAEQKSSLVDRLL